METKRSAMRQTDLVLVLKALGSINAIYPIIATLY